MTAAHQIDEGGLGPRIEALPGFAAVAEAVRSAGVGAWVVGGAVRDSLLGLAAGANLDVVVDCDPLVLAERLAGDVRHHERFNTATVYLPDASIDLAMVRGESYPEPGALPVVHSATLEEDLARRDFSVNALAVGVSRPGTLIDSHGGRDDLAAGLVRVLHERSFIDDPTRALRAARYAARLDLDIEPQTLTLLLDSDFTTVSADRIDGELERLAAEPQPERALALLAEWGLVSVEAAEINAFGAAARLAGEARWRGSADLGRLLVEIVRGDLYERSNQLAAGDPATASAAVDLAANRGGEEILLARALGGEWLDRYVDEWRGVKLEISGDDLLAEGIPQGPAIGRGLEAALRAKLDAGVASREDELRIALEAART